jgi:predicted Zn-dependent protease
MLSRMRNASELAGVLGHEMAHVRADHFTDMQRRATLSSIPSLVAAILSKGDPRVISGVIAAAQSYQLAWSREMELESDRLALQYLERTPFAKEGMLGALEVIEQGERLQPGDAPEHLMTHPGTTMRIAAMEGGLLMAPGKKYEPERDPRWDRLQAVLLARTEKPYVIRRKYENRLQENSTEANALMGLVLATQENYGEAEKFYRLALESRPREADILADLGAALFNQGRFEEARDALGRCLDLGGGYGPSFPWYYLGEIHKLEGNREAEYEAYEKAVSSWPPISEAHYQFALHLAEEKRLGEADFHFGKAAQLRGDYATALRSYHRAEARLGSDPVWGSKISAELWSMQ